MNPQELKSNALKFLGHMLTDPSVHAEVANLPESGPGPGKDAAPLGLLMAKHLNLASPPTNEEVKTMAGHIQEATATLRATLTEHAPAHADQFSPSAFFIN